MRVLSLFSGIGAFETALDKENINWELDHYCEIDKFACQSYNMIHGTTDKDNLKDIRNIDYSQIGEIDLLTYGFPCQDISLSGNLKGFVDENGNKTRSGLFLNAAEVIMNIKPKFAIFENVKNLTSKRFQDEFNIVLKTLDEIGYNTYWKVLNAKDYGIPQNRERVFGVSIRKDIDKGYSFPKSITLSKHLIDVLEDNVPQSFYIDLNKFSSIILNTKNMDFDSVIKVGKINSSQDGIIVDPRGISPTHTAGHGNTPKIIERSIVVKENNKKGFKDAFVGDSVNFEQPNSKTRRGRVGEQVAQTLTTGCHQGVVLKDDCSKKLRIRKLTPRECWRLMGFGDCNFDKIYGISNSQLYKQAGNSIVVDVLQYIFKELKKQYPEYFMEIK